MSYRTTHDWVSGARLPSGDGLSTCAHCGVLRVEHADGIGVHFIRRTDGDERVVNNPPPCIVVKPFTIRPKW